MKPFFMKAAVFFSAAAILCACGKADVKRAQGDSFAFDTFVTVTDYNGSEQNVTDSITQLNQLSGVFQSAYGVNANTLDAEDLRECLSLTAELNSLYGNMVNLTCGAITELWGISTDEPHVPNVEELEKALLTVGNTDYYGGNLGDFPDGTMLDFGSVAKGYACDRLYESLKGKEGVCQIISLGSSTLLYGEKPDGSLFAAAVKNPDNPEEYLGVITTEAAYISTSGGYERFFENEGVKYQHIISAETGYPVETDLTSVTVIVPMEVENGGIMSDFLSTAIYAGGTAQMEKFLGAEDFKIIATDENKNVYVSGGVDFKLYENSEYRLA